MRIERDISERSSCLEWGLGYLDESDDRKVLALCREFLDLFGRQGFRVQKSENQLPHVYVYSAWLGPKQEKTQGSAYCRFRVRGLVRELARVRVALFPPCAAPRFYFGGRTTENSTTNEDRGAKLAFRRAFSSKSNCDHMLYHSKPHRGLVIKRLKFKSKSRSRMGGHVRQLGDAEGDFHGTGPAN